MLRPIGRTQNGKEQEFDLSIQIDVIGITEEGWVKSPTRKLSKYHIPTDEASSFGLNREWLDISFK